MTLLTFKPFFYYIIFTGLQCIFVHYQLSYVNSTEVTINIIIVNVLTNIILYVYSIFRCTIEDN